MSKNWGKKFFSYHKLKSMKKIYIKFLQFIKIYYLLITLLLNIIYMERNYINKY